MKLRIHQNSIRFRLTQSEVAALLPGRWLQQSLTFTIRQQLTYRLEVAEHGVNLIAHFEDSLIRVIVPPALAARLSQTDQVSISAKQKIDQNNTLEILIEKDFQCLHPTAPHDADADAYPNPRQP
jgi:hypothetical protein